MAGKREKTEQEIFELQVYVKSLNGSVARIDATQKEIIDMFREMKRNQERHDTISEERAQAQKKTAIAADKIATDQVTKRNFRLGLIGAVTAIVAVVIAAATFFSTFHTSPSRTPTRIVTVHSP